MKYALLFLLCAVPASSQEVSTASMRAIALGEALSLSAARSEELAAGVEGLALVEAAEKRARASFRPALDLNASHVRQQGSDPASRGYLSASYGVFSGMRDYLAARAAAARSGAAALELRRARQELSRSAAAAFLSLQAAQRELAIRREQIDISASRIRELESRAAIGRTRKSEVVSARAQLAQDRAAYLAAVSGERLAQEALRFLTGLAEDLAPSELAATPSRSLEDYLRASASRPDVEAAARSAEAYGLLRDAAFNERLPSLRASGNYYILKDPRPSPVNRWDAGLYLSLPLYSGGTLAAGRSAASAGAAAAGLRAGLAARRAASEVRSAWDEHRLAKLRAERLEEALALAAQNAALQGEDYRLGLVTNLEVLNAFNSVLQTRLALSQARAQAAMSLIELETAAGLEPR